ncbi:carboxypeptidase B-like [Apis dorsata]|uniref:carboxypeptidase B-like n=1 Tax=Apis dorsata TaxID=7462 RepID=UPI0003DF7C79|nr:carboxypeptidase B-like [Apis dorsata]
MRVFFLIATIFVAAALAVDDEFLPSLRRMQSISISYQTPEQFSFLKNFMDTPGFDFVRTTSDLVDVLVTGDKVEWFKQLLNEKNMDYTVMIEDVEEIVTEEYITQEVERKLKSRIQDYASGRLSFTYYPKYNEVNEYLNYLTKAYSNVASLITIGNSYEGRVMKVLKLSTGGKNKPAIFIDGGIHAREWIAPATVLYMVDLMLSSHKDLLNKVDWYVLPVLNPDGYEFTHTKSANRLWRKTRSPNSGSTCRGVDGNRNYDLGWMEIGASNNPCSETYAGPKAFSEVENQHLRDFILARKGQFKAYLTFHSYGQYILYPWGFTSQVPPNEPELRNLASSCAKAIAKSRKTQYTYGTSANHLYPAAGGSDDWAMGKAGINLSYTFELPGGNYGFLLPASEIKAVGTETFEAIKQIHQYVTSKYA